MEKNKLDASFSVNQIIALNQFISIYKGIGIAITILCLGLGITCMSLANKNPVVVIESGNEYSYFQGRHQPVKINENNIKHFVEDFVIKYYNWNNLNPELILKNIGPLITDEMKESILSNLKNRKDKEFLGKTIQQSVAGISIDVTKESTIANFDVVLRVDNVPLIVSTQLVLKLVQGMQTEWNPMGLYVNNLTIHEGK